MYVQLTPGHVTGTYAKAKGNSVLYQAAKREFIQKAAVDGLGKLFGCFSNIYRTFFAFLQLFYIYIFKN